MACLFHPREGSQLLLGCIFQHRLQGLIPLLEPGFVLSCSSFHICNSCLTCSSPKFLTHSSYHTCSSFLTWGSWLTCRSCHIWRTCPISYLTWNPCHIFSSFLTCSSCLTCSLCLTCPASHCLTLGSVQENWVYSITQNQGPPAGRPQSRHLTCLVFVGVSYFSLNCHQT